MKFTVVFVGLLGLLIASGFSYTINSNNESNVGGSGPQAVSINNQHNVANVDSNNGWGSWNALWDYENSFAATRIFAKKSCIVHKMNKNVMPSLQELDTLVKEQKVKDKEPEGATPKELMFSINPTRVEDLSTFGPKIAGMCQGIPTYVAEEIPARQGLADPNNTFAALGHKDKEPSGRNCFDCKATRSARERPDGPSPASPRSRAPWGP
ncbi:gastrokine-1 isoform X2 [Cricetulus griseus]|uniref:Gastrokine-1 n=1 Tax=Cricetulus griseus TaxID=10029 RepID=A0A9J7H842_CRIGR|nr:gastrokine-1 isoform X2 [Cricetulus griseus]